MVSNETLEVIELTRQFNAPIERVFDAWTDPLVLAEWFGPVGFTVQHSSVDLTIGGKYLITIVSPEKQLIKHYGCYLAIDKPYQLIFTWMLDNQACKGSENECTETLVTIDLIRLSDKTELRLKHEKLPNKQAYDGHLFGWTSSMDSLEEFLN